MPEEDAEITEHLKHVNLACPVDQSPMEWLTDDFVVTFTGDTEHGPIASKGDAMACAHNHLWVWARPPKGMEGPQP